MSVENGRQVGSLDEIRKDHVNRYKFAIEYVKENFPETVKVTDAACGVGYGSFMLAEAGFEVSSIDVDAEAFIYLFDHYMHKNIKFTKIMDFDSEYEVPETDVVISFETIEHLKNPKDFLLNLDTKYAIVSVPNQDVVPFDPNRHLYHQRHYTFLEFVELVESAGYKVIEFFGQVDKESEVIKVGHHAATNLILVLEKNV